MSRSIFFSKPVLSLLGLSVAAVTAVAACSPPESTPGEEEEGGGELVVDDKKDDGVDVTTLPATDGCGDGKLQEDEACDDGNLESGDGCGSNCRYIEASYICPDEGEPCRAYALCGDGLVIFPEQCDDGGLEAGDGCSASCKVEVGYRCDGMSPSSCVETVCGDNIMEGSETCDDGNTMPFDGCSPSCQAEPVCTTEGCTSSCGDGVVVGDEECDDGNLVDDDGCNSKCEVEEGYMCPQGDPCEDINGECGLTLPIIFRDFSSTHSDFQVECGELVLGLVDETLDNGKPAANPSADLGKACISSASSLKQWYSDNDLNMTVPGEIVLFQSPDGSFVNRLTNTGQQYTHPAGTFWCADNADESDCNACDPGYTECQDPCTDWNNNQVCAKFAGATPVNGNPLFFPLDTLPGAPFLSVGQLSSATIPGPVYGGGSAGGGAHNFHFTSEVTHWFKYTKGEELNLAFNGDDDVWVYINNHLAVDLGGLHEPVEGKFELAEDGTVTLTTATKPIATIETKSIEDFGMTDGNVYEIKVFHAERKTSGSSFKLTLSGFNTARSECAAICGDGILAAGEQCDDGEDANVGGHNRCNSDCTLGSYCGDGIKQDEEECDDNDPEAPNTCSGCRLIVVR